MTEQFWVSTGDIREPYVPTRIVATYEGIPAPAFGKIDYNAGFTKAIDALAIQTQKAGCNGLIWVSFSPMSLGALGFVVFATGTALKVTPNSP